jgi:T5orf172 domain
VYVLDDGHAFKIGYTKGYVAARVKDLQTGNPRLIRMVAEVGSASEDVEAHLHTAFGEWNLQGEWFEREPLKRLVADSGGWEELLRQRLPAPPDQWNIIVAHANP